METVLFGRRMKHLFIVEILLSKKSHEHSKIHNYLVIFFKTIFKCRKFTHIFHILIWALSQKQLNFGTNVSTSFCYCINGFVNNGKFHVMFTFCCHVLFTFCCQCKTKTILPTKLSFGSCRYSRKPQITGKKIYIKLSSGS